MPYVKGIALFGIVKALRSLRSTAEPKVPTHLHRYFDERVIVSQWYPEADYVALMGVVGEIMAERVSGDVWEFLGEEGARAQFSDIYAMAVRVGDPAGTLRRATTTWSLYHDTGRIEVKLDEAARRAVVELHDFTFAEPRLCATITGYLRQLLLQSGASGVTARLLACPAPMDGPAVWEATWRAVDGSSLC
jgi:hypothetical protein